MVSWNRLVFKIDAIETMDNFCLGISMPIVPFSGICAIRTLEELKDNAISSPRPINVLILIPGASVISKRTTLGPMWHLIVDISTPKDLSKSTNLYFSLICSSSLLSRLKSLSYRCNKSSVG